MMVQCRPRDNCVDGFERVTIQECCYPTNPRGEAFTIAGVEGCHTCSEGKNNLHAY